MLQHSPGERPKDFKRVRYALMLFGRSQVSATILAQSRKVFFHKIWQLLKFGRTEAFQLAYMGEIGACDDNRLLLHAPDL